MSRAFRALVLVTCLSSLACTQARTSHPPGPITSSEIASALTRPREHRDAPLGVRDTAGRPYALSQDEPIVGPAPPDGRPHRSTVRALATGCEDRYRVAPAHGPCWFAETFTVLPTDDDPDARPDAGVVRNVIAGGFVLGLVGATVGTAYCVAECPEPWDSAAPVLALLVVSALVVVVVATVR